MSKRRICVFFSGTILILVLLIISQGCGKSIDLSFNESPKVPIVIYYKSQAIAPVYNPNVPVAVLYGDGKIIVKESAYDYYSGKASGGVSSVLEAFSKAGFFDFKPEYKGEPRVGGATEMLTVNLKAMTKRVVVEAGQEPSSWHEITALLTDGKISGKHEWIPSSITLFAREKAGTAEGATAWPGKGQELENASKAGSDGLYLQGEDARVAWTAIRDSFKEKGSDTIWIEGGKTYTYVYASPHIPGITMR